MRTFEMRMDEIRRRSERIRVKRKRQRRMVSICVPVLLCVVLYTAAAVLPHKAQIPASSGLGPMGATTGSITGGFSSDVITEKETLPVNRIEISCKGVSESISDSERILSVVKALDAFTGITDDSKYSASAEDKEICVPSESECRSENTENFGTADSKLADYFIVLYMQDGTVAVYTLNGNKLCAAGAQKAVVLRSEQLEKLKKILDMDLS